MISPSTTDIVLSFIISSLTLIFFKLYEKTKPTYEHISSQHYSSIFFIVLITSLTVLSIKNVFNPLSIFAGGNLISGGNITQSLVSNYVKPAIISSVLL